MNSSRKVEIALTLLLLAVLATLLSSCTLVPGVVEASEPSFDGNQRNSGFLGYTAEGDGVITPRAYDRYNTLIAAYGQRFTPPLRAGAGCRSYTNGTWRIDNQHEVYFKRMQRWHRSAVPKERQ